MANMESTRAAIQQMKKDLSVLLRQCGNNEIDNIQTLVTAMDANWTNNLLTPIGALNPVTDNATVDLD